MPSARRSTTTIAERLLADSDERAVARVLFEGVGIGSGATLIWSDDKRGLPGKASPQQRRSGRTSGPSS